MTSIIDLAIEKYNPKYIIAMFSGGHDSLVATHIVSQHPRFSFAAHMNTGIGIEQTRVFVRETCRDWGIELREYKAADYIQANGQPTPQCYRQMVTEHGFPGPSQHHRMYRRLKERPLRMMIRELDRNRSDKVVLVSGARRQESVRRKKHSEEMHVWEGTKVWANPIWDWSKRDVLNYIKEHDLSRNPVSDILHMSGECLCGAFAKSGELAMINDFFPEIGKELLDLQTEVMKHFPWGWEDSPPSWWSDFKNGQEFLPGFAPLCTSCQHRERGKDDNKK